MSDGTGPIDNIVPANEHVPARDTFEARYRDIFPSIPRFTSASTVSELVGYDFNQATGAAIAVNGEIDSARIQSALYSPGSRMEYADIQAYESLVNTLKR